MTLNERVKHQPLTKKEFIARCVHMACCITCVLIIIRLGVRFFDVQEAEATLGVTYTLNADWAVTDSKKIFTLPQNINNDTVRIQHNLAEEYSNLSVNLFSNNCSIHVFLDDKPIFDAGVDNPHSIPTPNRSVEDKLPGEDRGPQGNNPSDLPQRELLGLRWKIGESEKRKGQLLSPQYSNIGHITFDINYEVTSENVLYLELNRIDKNKPMHIDECTISKRDIHFINTFRKNIVLLTICLFLLIIGFVYLTLDGIRVVLHRRMRGLALLAFFALITIFFSTFNTDLVTMFIGNSNFLSIMSTVGYSVIPLILIYFYSLELKQYYPIFGILEYIIDMYTLVILAAPITMYIDTSTVITITLIVTIATIIMILCSLIKWKVTLPANSITYDCIALCAYLGNLICLFIETYTTYELTGPRLILITTTFISFLIQHIQILMMSYHKSVQTYNIILQQKVKDAEEARYEAVLANKSKDSFLANMSHEIRTPINAILGIDEVILRETENKEVKAHAMDIFSSGQILLSLINDILDFSKIESGKMEIVPVEYDVSSMINDLINMTKARLKNKEIELITEIDKTIPSCLYGDDVRIRQVITNILTNAVKYTKTGKIWFRMNCDFFMDDTEIISLNVEVQDTGIGIKAEDLPKLTQAYQRIEESRNRNIEGTGLGMNITTQLLSLMNSKLEVSSVYNEGSTFGFSITQKIINTTPIGDFQSRIEQSAHNFHYAESFQAPDAKVLIVDDNSINRKVFISLLKVTKVQVTEASGGEEAISLAKNNKYHIIFMDHMMPEVDGVEAMHRIREFDSETPIFVLTANAVTGAREYYLNEGFTGFLTKPIDSKKLETTIQETLPQELLQTVTEIETKEDTKIFDISQLPMIEGLDWNIAIIHLNTPDLLEETVKNFYKTIIPHAQKLDNLYADYQSGDEEALNQYRILVHSMKSSAAMLGIIAASGMARLLEYAARDHDDLTLFHLHAIFITEWNTYTERLKGVFSIGEQSSNKEIDRDTLSYFLTTLQQASEDFDSDTMDKIAKQLEEFSYSDNIQIEMEAIINLIAELDTDGILEHIDKVRSNLG